MLEPSIAIVERDAAVEGAMDLYFGAGETEAARLGMNLQPLTVPLHNVVVADDALVGEAADAFEILRSRAPSLFGIARNASEAAIIIGDEALQHSVCGIQIAGSSEAEFAGEAILKNTPETFDAAFGLRRLRGDESDAELRESAAKLSRLAQADELFVD